MFKDYQNAVIITIALLKQLKVKINNETVDDVLQNHPDYPSLLSISDALNSWKIDNAAAKKDINDINQISTPFIACTNSKEYPFVLVNKTNDNNIEVLAKSMNKLKIFKKDEFLKIWNGVYLLAETNELSGENNYSQNKFNVFASRLIPAIAIAILLFLSFLLINLTILRNNITYASTVYLQYFIFLVGVIITTMLLWYEIDKNNPVLQKVCTGILKSNCNAIITGKASKVFTWLSWSEVGFFYFLGGFLCLVFIPLSPLPFVFNLLSLPYLFFSIYYQGIIAKEWCVFCLSVLILILLGGVNIIFNDGLNYFTHSSIFNFSNSFISILLYITPILLWYSLKPIILKLQQAKQIKREYFRLKYNNEIFKLLLHKEKDIKLHTIQNLGIEIGNPMAKNSIIKVCSPYCGPCAKAHPKIDSLLEENNNIKVKIIFAASNDDNDLRNKPIKLLLAIAAEGNDELIKQALDDWYLADKKDYDAFSRKYIKYSPNFEGANFLIAEMNKWCIENDIQFTPTIFVNGHQLPNAYSIEDLNYFLLE